VTAARNSAVPCYATLLAHDPDCEPEWVAPGEMGWFGMSSDSADDRAAYDAQINRFLDAEMPGDAVLVVLDLHI
jgi:hypothetical protein